MKNLSFEQIQRNLIEWMGDTVKPETKSGYLTERTYIKALLDAGTTVPPICLILVKSRRSIVTFK